VFGLREAEAVGQPLSRLFAVPLGTGLGTLPVARPDVGSPLLEVPGRRADGATFPAEVTFTEAQAGDHVIYTVFVRDISDRKRAAEEREGLEAQLRHAQKMETIGTLAGGIAHDFNNILTPIIGHVELALADTGAAGVSADLDQVRRAALRAKDLVKQILLFSRRGEKAFSPVELGPVVKEALKLLRSSLPATIEIRSSVAADVMPVVGDPTQLHQVLMNLCTNAYHAMRERGGLLDVRLEMARLDPRASVAIPQIEGDRAVRLAVRDTGHGMDAATLERLFEPFFTTKPVGEGTGLGMSIVHGIITDHGGTITVASQPGAGTTFEIYLPPAQAQPGSGVAVAAGPDARGEGRILVVDDDAVIARLVARVLQRQGYEVVPTTSPTEVGGMLANAERPFDLVITDQTMPGMTGLQLAQQIARWRPGFPVILMSGYSEFGDRRDPGELGLRDLLTKPVEMDVLTTAVGRVLRESRAGPAGPAGAGAGA
jgi:signal transduction histidine kinase/ActR/RegA family two-component response regulator